MKNDYESYINDYFKLSPVLRFIYGKKDKECLSHYDNVFSDDYMNKVEEIIDKYKDTKHNELKIEIENMKYVLDNKLYLLLFSSYVNFIVEFNYDTNNIYPKNEKYKKSRQIDFDKYILSVIEKAKIGIKLKITYPKIIIKKFLTQIKNEEHYKHLYNFIKNNYYPYCRNEIGFCYLKNGKEHYKFLINEYIGNLDITPEEIHKIGLELPKKRIISTNKFSSRDEMMQTCLDYSNYLYDNFIEQYFHFKPKQRFILVPVPLELEKSSALGYYNDLEQKVFINLSYYNEISKNEIKTLIMHECFHFYHFKYMKHLNLPKYSYYSYNNIALVEGFAHYMEIYCDDYDDLNNINTLVRKLRLVVDTGINYYGWTYKQAFDYMKKYLPDKITDIKNEIDRYICMPGQAVCYYIGKIHIIKLRDEYLKNGGNIKDFHYKLLKHGLASFTTINKEFI
jgi:uncharacterized protein (DUF885 family)